MIEPMKKVSIVILNKEREQALKSLRKLGLVHLEKLEGSGEKLSSFKEAMNNALLCQSVLGEIKLTKQEIKKAADTKLLTAEETIKLCSEVVSKIDRKKALFDQISADANELERFFNWGEVSPDDFNYLKEKGIQLKLYEIASDNFSDLDKDLETILVNRDRKYTRFLILNGGEGRPEKLSPEAFEVPFPREDTNLLKKEIEECKVELSQIESFLREKTADLSSIKNLLKTLSTDIEFETVNSGMQREETGAENELAWLTGYVPVADMQKFSEFCTKNQWAYAVSDPAEEDPVPTKLKNNKFVSLIYPLTDFLGTVPGYREFDISGWFLLFFAVFFGMIFGDGGYGLLVTAIAILMILKNLFTKKKVPALLGLVTLVGFATIGWGIVTCTWFGLKPEQLPAWLVNLSIPQISNAYTGPDWTPFWKPDATEGLTNAQNLQIFCFSLALLQLSVAHIKAMIRNRKSLKVLGDFGALLQLIGMYWVVLSMVVSSSVFSFTEKIYGFPIGLFEICLVGVGFVLSFIFSNYEGSIGASVLESCKNIISVLLGVVNVFSDIVSYIRLWAVGLAGAAISNTVNEMAGPLLGHFITFIFFVMLVAFGHGLNMILNLLSVIVHGVRLNTLEFSSHLGMSWSGLKYSPFSEKVKK